MMITHYAGSKDLLFTMKVGDPITKILASIFLGYNRYYDITLEMKPNNIL